MPRFLHISDLHFPTKLSIFSLRKKMFLGYYNFTIRRKHKHPQEIYDAIIQFAHEQPFDGILITGDITNVAAEKEFVIAKEKLSPLLTEKTLLIPGNHDRYTLSSIKPTDLFIKYFKDYLGEDVSKQKNVYLRSKVLAGIHFLCWDSNEPTSITEASGRVTTETLIETERYLAENNLSNFMLLCHHPIWNPPGKPEPPGHKMSDRESLVKWLNKYPPRLYLHGHQHTNWLKQKDENIGFPILNSASSTRVTDSTHDCGIHTFSIDNGVLTFERYEYKYNSKKFEPTNLIAY